MKQPKKTVLAVLVIVLILSGGVQGRTNPEERPVKLIVNAADGGLLHSINLGIEKCFNDGILTTATVIVPGSWFHHFAKFARENPGLTVGVHLAVASGLFPYPCRPVSPYSEVSSLVDHQGYLFDNLEDFRKNNPTFEHIKKELRAQIELAYKEGIDVAFLDSHIGGTRDISRAINELAEEFGLPQKGKNGEIDVMDLYYTPCEEKTNKMAELINARTTEPGVYLSRHHPALNTAESRALKAGNTIYKGIEWALHREAEANAILSKEVREVISRKNIQLTGFYKKKRDEIRSTMKNKQELLERIKALKAFKYPEPDELLIWNKTPAVFKRAVGKVIVDGNLNEFINAVPVIIDGRNEKSVMTLRGSKWGGEKDLSGIVKIMYDTENLYIGLKVKDDIPFINPNDAYEIHKGDCLEVYLCTDSQITYKMRGIVKKSDHDIKFTLAPTCKKGIPVILLEGKEPPGDKAKISSKKFQDGYSIEASVSLSLLTKSDWKVGDKLKFEASLTDSDGDRFKSKIYWSAENRKAWANPNFWGIAQIK